MRRILWVLAIVLLAGVCAIPLRPGGVALAETVEVGDVVPVTVTDTDYTGNGVTALSAVAADATGYVHTITMYVSAAGATGVKVGIFYETGANTYKCRAAVGLSDQTSGKKTIRLDSGGSGISLETHAGDLIGFYCSGGNGLRYYTGADTGDYIVSGDYVTGGAEATFTSNATYGLRLHGSSSTNYFQVFGMPYPYWYGPDMELVGYTYSCTSTAWGIVIGDSSHDEPGNVAPTAQTDYMVDRYQESETNSGVFYKHYYPAGLSTGVTYYVRAAIYITAPYNSWEYGPEMDFEVPTAPDETCHRVVTTEPVVYNCVYTDNVAIDSRFGQLTFGGSVSSAESGIDRAGWVYDTSSHANPDGYPTGYSDVAPEASDYPGLVEATVGDLMQTTFQETVNGWSEATYYYRFFVDFSTPGDYIYGPELEFDYPEPECVEWERQTQYEADEYAGDPLCTDIWAMENIGVNETHSVNALWLSLWRSGNPTYVDAYVYECDFFTWEPIGSPLASAAIDVSAITTDPAGEWVEADLNNCVTLEVDHVYAILLKGRAPCEEPWNVAVWTTTDGATSEGFGTYAYSWDSGSNWTWPDRDGLYQLWCCTGDDTTHAALFETWGYTPSTYPAWYQAWPSFLKLAYIGIVLTSAVLAYRYEPKREYPPDLPDMPELPPQ